MSPRCDAAGNAASSPAYEEHELPVLAFMLMAARHYLANRFVLASASTRTAFRPGSPNAYIAVRGARTGQVTRGLAGLSAASAR